MTAIFLIGAVLFAIAALYFFYNTYHVGFIAAVLGTISTIACVSYLFLAQGVGFFIEPDGGYFFWGRYVEWAITTSLLLFCIYYVSANWKNLRWFFLVIALNVSTMMSALLVEYFDNPILFIFGCVTYTIFVLILWKKFFTKEKELMSKTLSTSLIVLWTLYPVIWIMGESVLGLYSIGSASVLFLYLDLLTKVGFGIMFLHRMKYFN